MPAGIVHGIFPEESLMSSPTPYAPTPSDPSSNPPAAGAAPTSEPAEPVDPATGGGGSGGGAPAGPDPEKELEQKKQQLDQSNAALAQAQKTVDKLKAEIQTLEGGVGEVQAVVKEYGTVRPNLEKERDMLIEITDQHTKEVEAVLGPIAQKVRDEVNKVDAAITARETAAATKEAEWKASQAAEAQAKADEAQAEAEFTARKKVVADKTKALGGLKKIREAEAAADAANKHRQKAYLLHDLKNGISAFALPTPDELKAHLVDALNGVTAKKAAYKAAKEAAEAKKKAFDEAKSGAQTARAGREAAIITAIEKIS
jgi:hypothetical protein